MTKFTTLKEEVVTKTTFVKFLNSDGIFKDTTTKAEDFDNVLHLGREEYLGDLFKTWDNGDEKRFNIYIGVKGDEFN